MTSVEPTDKPSPELFNIIKNVDQKVISMQQKLRMQSTIPLDDTSKGTIKSDLESLRSTIVQMSDLCIKKVDDMSKDLNNLDSQITEIDGILEFVNEAAGAVLFNQVFIKPENESSTQLHNEENQFTLPAKKKGCAYPGEDYFINMGALENIGRKITEPSTNALMISIPPEQISTAKKPFSSQEDFFKKQDPKLSHLLFD